MSNSDAGVVVEDRCGDGRLATTEACDDGNAVGGDGCDADCGSVEEHFECRVPGEPCVALPYCGDGVVNGDDVCDDGNAVSNDGCSAGCDDIEPYFECRVAGEACTRVPFDEVLEAGLDKYFGTFEPPNAEVVDNVTTYTWSGESRPYCLSGEYTFAAREGSSNDLVIVLGGGGVCVPNLPIYDFPVLGGIVRAAIPNGFCTETARPEVRSSGVLDEDNAENPFEGWSGAFLPNCDGSVFVGDTEERPGLRNLTAALEALHAQFPNPNRIALVGLSAGGFGLLTALPLVRSLYPDAQLFVVADAAIAVGTPRQPEFLRETIDMFNVGHIVEAACNVADSYTECEEPDHPHLTWLYDYALREDSNTTIAGVTSDEDLVMGGLFLALFDLRPRLFPPGLDFDISAYGDAVEDAVTPVSMAHPGRFEAFLYEGSQHGITVRNGESEAGFLDVLVVVLDLIGFGNLGPQLGSGLQGLYTVESNDVRLVDWLQAMVDGTDDFRTVLTD